MAADDAPNFAKFSLGIWPLGGAVYRCETTSNYCDEQQGASSGAGWVFCDPETQKAELPDCTCESEDTESPSHSQT